jgi:hypothetical protein
MINGRAFDWESIKIRAIWGANIEITNISYSSEAPVEAVFGRGNTPRAYGVGNLAQEGSLDIPHNSFQALQIYAATQGGLLRIRPFDIIVEYSNEDQIPQIDILPAVKISKVETEASQGDTEIGMRTISFTVLNPILLNGVPVI